MGNAAEALRLARQSAEARPYSFEVQRVAAHLLLTHGEHNALAKATIQTASQLDPDFADYQIIVLGFTGDFKAMAELSLPPLSETPVPSGGAKLAPLSALQHTMAA